MNVVKHCASIMPIRKLVKKLCAHEIAYFLASWSSPRMRQCRKRVSFASYPNSPISPKFAIRLARLWRRLFKAFVVLESTLSRCIYKAFQSTSPTEPATFWLKECFASQYLKSVQQWCRQSNGAFPNRLKRFETS